MIRFTVFLDNARDMYEWCEDNLGNDHFCSDYENKLHKTTMMRPSCSFWIIGDENITAFKLMWAEVINNQKDV
jgi:hypothetical protein